MGYTFAVLHNILQHYLRNSHWKKAGAEMMYMEEKTVKQVDEIMSHLMHNEIYLQGQVEKGHSNW